MPESELIETIQGVFRPTAKMLVGQAFGRCLEKPAKYRHEDSQGERYVVPVKVGDTWTEYVFPGATVQPCLERFDPRGVFEAKTTKQYGNAVVVSKVDQIVGARIVENKAKLTQFDFDKYAKSSQWRFYLDAFEGAVSVTYNVFMLDEPDSLEGRTVGPFTLNDVHSFNLFPYDGLHNDCAELVGRFVDYVDKRSLTAVLEERQLQWA